MLLEAQIVSRMALLFGTTWMVNSVVVAGLLLLIVAANLVFKFAWRCPGWLSYALLFMSLIALFLVPTATCCLNLDSFVYLPPR